MRYWALWALLIVAVGAFAMQVAARVRLIVAAPGRFSFDDFGVRLQRFLLDVVLQRRTIRERPIPGAAHALVFWGFAAFAGSSDGQGDWWFHGFNDFIAFSFGKNKTLTAG